MSKIDKIDTEIINILLEDGRKSASEIARLVDNISERAVRYRIDRLVEEGMIRINAIINPQAFGLDTYADVWMEVESDRIVDVANRLVEEDAVTYVACSLGESDVSIQIVAKDNVEIYRFVTEVVRKIPGVRKTVTSIVPTILKDIYQWRIPKSVVKNISKI